MAVLAVSEVRAQQSGDTQAFVVIDTAAPDNRAHASIYAFDHGCDKVQARRLRKLLFPLLRNRRSLDEVFRA